MSNQSPETIDLSDLLKDETTFKSKSYVKFSGLPEAYANEIECSLIEVKSIKQIEPEKVQNEEYFKQKGLPGNEIIENQPNKIEHKKHEPTSSLTKGIGMS